MKISAINSTSFNGIYKIKASKKEDENHRVERFLSENPDVFKISIPFEENGRKYFYAVTREVPSEEKSFETELKKSQIPYWKAAPLIHLCNNNLLDKIFETDRLLQGKESWIKPQN